MANLSVNQKKCIGCDTCVKNAPDIFEIDIKNFKCRIKNRGESVDSVKMELSAEQIKMIKKAIKDCPTGSIKLSD